MNCRLIAFDLDGTLLTDDKQIPPENLDALRKAGEKGILIVPASGRLYPYMPENVRSLPYARYFITNNGGTVYDSQTGELMYSAEIPLELSLKIFDYLSGIDVIYDCYSGNDGYGEAGMLSRADDYFTDPYLNWVLHSYLLTVRRPVEDLRVFTAQRGTPLQKISAFFRDPELRLRELAHLPELFPEISATSSFANNIEINSVDATKGRALVGLCRRLGISRNEVVAFGDGLNDLDMIQFAGGGIAMVNGENKVKAAASRLSAADNNQAGIAKTLEEMGII